MACLLPARARLNVRLVPYMRLGVPLICPSTTRRPPCAFAAGNAGGVLLNSRGAVIGLNLGTLDPSGKGPFSGVGYAVPIDTVRGLVDQILAHGRVRRPSLGITIAPEQVRTTFPHVKHQLLNASCFFTVWTNYIPACLWQVEEDSMETICVCMEFSV
eukprot:GHRQ01040255.1.p1 GENE.GHRQ01040255.1~~GHRQ01040255.1.p1  ORF type:complete len:158 (+),score=13.03 GHRQ01040255.1:415-888(+)